MDTCFAASGQYIIPTTDGDVASYSSHIRSLPTVDSPELFGLHPNASITFNKQEAKKIIDAVLFIQPRIAAGNEDENKRTSKGGSKEATAGPATNHNPASSSGAALNSGGISNHTAGAFGSTFNGSHSSSTSTYDGSTTYRAGAGGSHTTSTTTTEYSAVTRAPDEIVLEAVQEMSAAVPPLLLTANASALHDPFAPLPNAQVNLLGIVLQQEMDR